MKIINVGLSALGMTISLIGTFGLWFTTHKFYLCITNPANSANLTNCVNMSSEDFPYVLMSILGIFLPIFAMVLTTNLKKDD